MRTAVCTGSFDPPTAGHLDIIGRAAKLFDRVYAVVLVNAAKKCAFTIEERCRMLEQSISEAGLDNVFVESFEGLTVDYAGLRGAAAIVRGLRRAEDLTYEMNLEAANRFLDSGIETIYLLSKPELSFISSSAVREIASYGREIGGLVPETIKNMIAERLI